MPGRVTEDPGENLDCLLDERRTGRVDVVHRAGERRPVGLTRRLKSYLDAGATDLALVPLQTEPAELRRLYEVAAAF